MNLRSFLIPTIVFGLGAAAGTAAPDAIEAPVPVSQAPTPSPSPNSAAIPRADGGDYQQRLYGPGGPLVAPEKANQVVQAFRASYDKGGKPRLLIYVNRELIDEHSGMKLIRRHEKTDTTVGPQKNSFEREAPAKSAVGTASEAMPDKGASESRTTTVTGENDYAAGDKAEPTLADKLTVREVETLIGRPFRVAGATLADQKVASLLIADQPIDHFTTATNDSARKDREALGKVADVVVEVLVSSRTATVADVSGDRSVSIPDIQVTAIRLSDSAIIGQASSSDVLGKGNSAARAVRQFDVREITEATALALMEDMTTSAK